MSNQYKIKHTSIMHNGELCTEGSVIELSDEQAKRLADFVTLVSKPKTQNQQNQNKTANNDKNGSKSEGGKSDGEQTV